MPTYEYRCAEGHTFERIQKMSEAPLDVCEVCGAPAARLVSGGQGLIFKGSGFYITDYGKDGKGPRKADGGGASGGDAGGASGAAAAPAPKADAPKASGGDSKAVA